MSDKELSIAPPKGRRWRWIVGGALYGVLLRVLFGWLPVFAEGAMSMGFLFGTPFVVGALTVYGARHYSPSVYFLLFAPWATVGLMMLGCAVALLEGSICIAIISPLLFVCASLGGLAMALALRVVRARASQLQAVAVLPLLIAFGERPIAPVDAVCEIRTAALVHASPETIWNQIVAARDIRPDELPFSITHLIGVPKPVDGINVPTPQGEVRFSRWQRGVHFQGVVTHRVPYRSIGWRYRFQPDSFPRGSMDEHVAIGGRYFDLRDTTFNLEPLEDGLTRLEIVAHYRVTTRVNFYAVPLARWLGGDFERTILGLYRRRSEQAVRG